MISAEDKFIWNIQLAGYDHDQADQKGEVTYQEFINEFEMFPWIEQIEKANQYPDKVSPTISISDLKTEKDFWISMAGDKNDHEYYLGYIYPKETKTLLGFGKTKTIRWLEMYTTDNQRTVKELIKLYFERDFNKLENSIRSLEEYGQMEAKDLAANRDTFVQPY